MNSPEKCEWPGCDELALCQSGNLAGLLVCSGHFSVSNGATFVAVQPESGKEN